MAVGVVDSGNVAGNWQGVHSQVIRAATAGLLHLAGKVPLLGPVADALKDLCNLCEVRSSFGRHSKL